MKLEDAPPAGWYPDPDGGSHLRWWEGTDWTDDRRAPPSAAELDNASRAAEEATPPAPARKIPRAVQVERRDTDDIVSQVRTAAREEAERAADLLAQRARATIDRGRSVVGDYVSLVLRWVRIIVVTAAVLVIAWFVLQFIAQASFLNWLGDRIDSFSGG